MSNADVSMEMLPDDLVTERFKPYLIEFRNEARAFGRASERVKIIEFLNAQGDFETASAIENCDHHRPDPSDALYESQRDEQRMGEVVKT